MVKEEVKKEEKTEKWVVTEIPETTKPAIVDTEAKEVYTIETALARILNDLEKLKKLLD
jgi:hypothetical protein